jgi:hypothetical protein
MLDPDNTTDSFANPDIDSTAPAADPGAVAAPKKATRTRTRSAAARQ